MRKQKPLTVGNVLTAPNLKTLYMKTIREAHRRRRVIRFKVGNDWFYVGPNHYFRKSVLHQMRASQVIKEVHIATHRILSLIQKFETAEGWRAAHRSGRHPRKRRRPVKR